MITCFHRGGGIDGVLGAALDDALEIGGEVGVLAIVLGRADGVPPPAEPEHAVVTIAANTTASAHRPTHSSLPTRL